MNAYKPYLGQNKHNWLPFGSSEEFWSLPDVNAVSLRPGFIRITQKPVKYYDWAEDRTGMEWKRYNELHAEYFMDRSIYFGFTIDPVEGLVYR